MPSTIARSAFLLTTLVVLLARGLRLAPDDLIVAGTSGLAVYALVAFGGAALQRAAARPATAPLPPASPPQASDA